jgi:HEAT repeat protein
VGAAFSSSFAERVAQTRALHSNLTLPEVQALYRYLLVSSSAAAQDREQENWLRNELMDKLTSQAMPPPELVQVLVAIYQDPAQDIVMRDYAVQHMRPAYVQAGPEQRDLLQQALWNAATETDSSVAGTALLALQSLGHEYKEIDADRLGAVSLNLAGEGRCGELSRITAVQVCGRLGLKQAAPLLTQLAQDADSIPLRIASIAALGDVGDEAARTWLQQLAGQADPRLRPALQTALNKLNRRQGT